jgi:hypothetical protein
MAIKGVQANEAAQARVFAHDAINVVVGALNWSAENGGIKITSGGTGFVDGEEITLATVAGTSAVFVVIEQVGGVVKKVKQKYTAANLGTANDLYESGSGYQVSNAIISSTSSGSGINFTAQVADIDLPNTTERGACLYVGNTQTELVVFMESGKRVVFKNVQQGNFLPIQVIQVESWTTAALGDIIALY